MSNTQRGKPWDGEGSDTSGVTGAVSIKQDRFYTGTMDRRDAGRQPLQKHRWHVWNRLLDGENADVYRVPHFFNGSVNATDKMNGTMQRERERDECNPVCACSGAVKQQDHFVRQTASGRGPVGRRPVEGPSLTSSGLVRGVRDG